MKKTYVIALSLFTAAIVAVLPARATTIQLELYNSYPLVDQNNSLLAGDSSGGDLVELILTGSGNTISPPNNIGDPSGNNSVLFTLYVGEGEISAGTGLLDAYPLNYDSSLVGTDAFVRFFNGTTVGGSTYYGDSSAFTLPAGDAFNQASVDFAPLDSSPVQTSDPLNLTVVPEPSSLFVFGLSILGAVWWRRRSRKPEAKAIESVPC